MPNEPAKWRSSLVSPSAYPRRYPFLLSITIFYNDYSKKYFDNGYFLTPAIKLYHNQMWLVLFTSLASSIYIIYSVMNNNFLENLEGCTEKWDNSKKKKIVTKIKNYNNKK